MASISDMTITVTVEKTPEYEALMSKLDKLIALCEKQEIQVLLGEPIVNIEVKSLKDISGLV